VLLETPRLAFLLRPNRPNDFAAPSAHAAARARHVLPSLRSTESGGAVRTGWRARTMRCEQSGSS